MGPPIRPLEASSKPTARPNSHVVPEREAFETSRPRVLYALRAGSPRFGPARFGFEPAFILSRFIFVSYF